MGDDEGVLGLTALRELQTRLRRARTARARADLAANLRREQAAMYRRAKLEIPGEISTQLRALCRRSARQARTVSALRSHLYKLTGSAFPEEEATP